MKAAVLKSESRARHEILHGARHKDLARPCECTHASADRHREASDIVARWLDRPRYQSKGENVPARELVLKEDPTMQFVIIARDGMDAEAPARRQAVRPTHLEAIRPFVEQGNIALGGAILDDEGTMIGSVLIVEFPTRQEMNAWLSADPYVTNGVWNDVEVHPYRAAVGAWLPGS
jgi:uncharacterized protein